MEYFSQGTFFTWDIFHLGYFETWDIFRCDIFCFEYLVGIFYGIFLEVRYFLWYFLEHPKAWEIFISARRKWFQSKVQEQFFLW